MKAITIARLTQSKHYQVATTSIDYRKMALWPKRCHHALDDDSLDFLQQQQLSPQHTICSANAKRRKTMSVVEFSSSLSSSSSSHYLTTSRGDCNWQTHAMIHGVPAQRSQTAVIATPMELEEQRVNLANSSVAFGGGLHGSSIHGSIELPNGQSSWANNASNASNAHPPIGEAVDGMKQSRICARCLSGEPGHIKHVLMG